MTHPVRDSVIGPFRMIIGTLGKQKGKYDMLMSTYMTFFGVVRQSGKSASASELGATHYDWRCGGLGYKQVSRVGVTHLWKMT